MISTTFYYHLFIFLLLFLVQFFGYICNKVLYDINPYFETEATQNLISYHIFCLSKLQFDIRLELNCNIKVFSVLAQPCVCDLSLSKYEDEKS